MQTSFLAIAVTATALSVLPINAYAACATSHSSAQVQQNNQVVKEIVDNAKVDPATGDVEASTGAAKPTENWMGCPPDNDEPRCQTPEGQAEMRQEAKSKVANDGTGEEGDINAKTDLQAQAKPMADAACADVKTQG